MEVSRKERGEVALMAIEMDTNIEDDVIEELKTLPHIIQVTRMVE
jgi:L-serine dehydratase